jgi:hypothetical protein
LVLAQADASIARSREAARALRPIRARVLLGRIESICFWRTPRRKIQVRILLLKAVASRHDGGSELAEAMRVPRCFVAEAVIRTGRRTVVIVALDGGRFAPTEIEIGRRSGDQIEVRRGLSEGQRVVASGQFLIDSEASLTGALASLEASSSPQAAANSVSQAASPRS